MPVCCIADTQRQTTNYTCINTHLQSSINLIHWIGWDSPWLPSWKMCSRIRESNSLFPLGRWMMWVFWFNQVVASRIWIRYDNWHMQLWSHCFLPEKGGGPNFKFNLSTLSTRRLTDRLMQHLQWCGWSTVLICCAEERAERYVDQYSQYSATSKGASWSVLGMLCCEEARRQAQDTLERIHVLAGLEVGREREVWLCISCRKWLDGVNLTHMSLDCGRKPEYSEMQRC